ncbi:MAG: hypothetical protein BGO30_08555 [Bacteroidetes bacterium 41-46]|nr:MAG: hypothetical protein BGO30_08555 [Bacteroidetes bacterium 41-46]
MKNFKERQYRILKTGINQNLYQPQVKVLWFWMNIDSVHTSHGRAQKGINIHNAKRKKAFAETSDDCPQSDYQGKSKRQVESSAKIGAISLVIVGGLLLGMVIRVVIRLMN